MDIDRKILPATFSILISVAALSVGVAAYLKIPAEEVVIVPPPAGAKESKGPIYAGSGTGHVIEFENGVRFYFAGDTALFSGMKLVIRDSYEPDVAFLPIGSVYTMGPKEAAYATALVNPKYVIPYYYHSFPELTQTADGFADAVNEYKSKKLTRAETIVLAWGATREIEGVKVTWLGHATILLESVNGARILIDPWLEANPDCPTQYKNITNLADIDIILLTHGHIDHVTIEELDAISEMYKPVIIAQWELSIYLQDYISVPLALMNVGGSFTKESLLAQGTVPAEIVNASKMENITITMVEAVHSSSPP